MNPIGTQSITSPTTLIATETASTTRSEPRTDRLRWAVRSASPGSSAPVSTSTPPTTTTTRATTTTPTTSTPPPAAALPYPTDVPAAARVDSPEGAQAFVKYYFAVINRSDTAPTIGSLPPLSTPTCKSCEGFESNAIGYVQAQVRYSPTPMEVLEVSLAPEPAGPDQLNVDVVARQRVSKGVDPTGKVVETLAAKSGIFFVTVRWTGEHWLLREIKVRG